MTSEISPADDPLAHLMRTRRTINDFRPELPPRDIVLQAIEVARWAPNHKLTQPWRFHFLGPEAVQRLIAFNTALITAEKGLEAAHKKMSRWARIPGWLLVTSLRTDDELRDRENYAAVCCAIQNLMLFLWSHDIGTKWSTGAFLRHPDFFPLLQLDAAAEQVVGLIWYGYAAAVPNSQRQPLSQIITEHP